jgi:hypothetical protein
VVNDKTLLSCILIHFTAASNLGYNFQILQTGQSFIGIPWYLEYQYDNTDLSQKFDKFDENSNQKQIEICLIPFTFVKTLQ